MTTGQSVQLGAEQRAKIPRQRSVAYPSYSIPACIELVTKIDKTFSDVVYTNRESISKELGLSGGALLMNLSSCVQYNLLELKQNEGYKPTAIFKKIKRPLPDENIRDAYIVCFRDPELYKKLINDFSGKQLPQEGGLANILDRKYGVVGNASSIAAKIFLRNVNFIGLLDEGNILNLENVAALDSSSLDDVIPPANNGAVVDQKHPLSLPPSSTDNSSVEIPVFLKGKRLAKIVLPGDFDDEDVAKVAKVISGYMP